MFFAPSHDFSRFFHNEFSGKTVHKKIVKKRFPIQSQTNEKGENQQQQIKMGAIRKFICYQATPPTPSWKSVKKFILSSKVIAF